MKYCSTTALNKNTVDNVTVSSAFTHTKFKERENIDGTGNTISSGTWNSETGKLTLNGKPTQPGIYTGEVEVTYKGGIKEKYTITLRKTPSDSLKYTADVKVGTVEINGLTLNNGIEDVSGYKFNSEDVTLTSKSTGKEAKVITNSSSSDNKFIFSALDLSNDGKLKEGDVLTLKVKYGSEKGKEYELTSEVLVVKQKTPKIEEAFMTNGTTGSAIKSLLESSMKANFDTKSTITIPETSKDVSTYVVNIGDQKILTYEQTYSGTNNKVGGAEIDVTIGSNTVDLKITGTPTADRTKDNFIPTFSTVSYGIDTAGNATKSTAVIGNYIFNIGGKPYTYFEALKGLTPSLAGEGGADASKKYRLEFKNSAGTESQPKTAIEITNPNINLDLSNNLEHGYTSISGIFEVDYKEDKEKIDSVNQSMNGTNKVPATFNTVANASDTSVKTSLIVVADTLDGAGTQTKFDRTSTSEGKLTLVGGKKLLGGITDLNKVKLTISGATVSVVGSESNGDNLVFLVQFNGQVPTTTNWTLSVDRSDKVKGTVNTGTVDAFNLLSLSATNSGTENVSDQFTVNVSYDTSTFSNGTPKVDNLDSNRVTLSQFTAGSHKINLDTSSGKYQGTYVSGIMVSRGSFTLGVTGTEATSTSVALKIKPTSLVSGAVDKINEGIIQYRESVTSGSNSNAWVNSNITFTTSGSNKEIKDKTEITKVVTGLTPGKTYDFRVTYRVNNGSTVQEEVITEVKNIKLSGSTSSGTISGGSGSSSTITGTGSSSSSSSTGNAATTTVTSTSSNTTVSSSKATVTLPTGFTYSGSSTPSVTGIKYKGKDGKSVTETKEEFKNVGVNFSNGRAEVEGLVPGKTYEELTVSYTDTNGVVKTLVLKDVSTSVGSESERYLSNVYDTVFNRPADETGYHYHYKSLVNKTTSLKDFLLNMLNEKEFTERYKTAEERVEGLYNAIVARTSDEEGKKFWVNEYKKSLAVYGTESQALQAIADRMVNETELKELAKTMNFKP